MRNIRVDPARLDECAARMEENRQDYDRCVRDLYSTVDTLQSAWRGRDNLAFTAEIQRFEANLRSLSVLCVQYADFLKNSSRAYRSTQDEIASYAGRLPG